MITYHLYYDYHFKYDTICKRFYREITRVFVHATKYNNYTFTVVIIIIITLCHLWKILSALLRIILTSFTSIRYGDACVIVSTIFSRTSCIKQIYLINSYQQWVSHPTRYFYYYICCRFKAQSCLPLIMYGVSYVSVFR